METELEDLLKKLNLEESVLKNTLKNKKLSKKFEKLLEGSPTEYDKPSGALIYKMISNLPDAYENHLPLLLSYVTDSKIKTSLQMDEAIKYLKTKHPSEELNLSEFENASGIGIIVNDEDMMKAVDKEFAFHLEKIKEERYRFNFGVIIRKVKEYPNLKWADGKKLTQAIEEKKISILGEKTEADLCKKKKKKKEEEKVKLEEEKKERLSQLLARDLYSSLNTPELLALHEEKTNGLKCITRFPPEPNGYLHIGHAKSINFNFSLAEDYNGICYLRYDDTNPEKETEEYIKSIEETVKWLGYTPYKVTYSSNHFDRLYELALKLIHKAKAYVCFLSPEQAKIQREASTPSPYRDSSVQDNLKLFEDMRDGKYEEQQACLRLKIDMTHPNPCMRDPVAYRIKKMPHPHVGDKWIIYPTYDYTHCLIDSFEWITHSCCTLEFEIRRDVYYWILQNLELYRPYQWEFSRLNISNTILSKRYIQEMVDTNIISGWDDPRIFTLMALKRRGVSPQAINEFCRVVGVTRRGNEMVIPLHQLEFCIRKDLDQKSPRTMAVLDPLMVVITNMEEEEVREVEAPLFPSDPSKGTQTYTLSKRLFIEKSDFKASAPQNFFGLTGKQMAILKYGFMICLEKIFYKDGSSISVEEEIKEFDEEKEISHLECRYVTESATKVKGILHWVSEKASFPAEIRLYDLLFHSENPKAAQNWKEGLDIPNSLKIIPKAFISSNLKNAQILDKFQFERLGYFCVDYDSDISTGKYVFNRTVTLVESKEKKNIKKGKK